MCEVSVGQIVRVNREGLSSITGTVHALEGEGEAAVVTIHEWKTGAMRSARVGECRVCPRTRVRGHQAGELTDWGLRERAALREREKWAREVSPRRLRK